MLDEGQILHLGLKHILGFFVGVRLLVHWHHWIHRWHHRIGSHFGCVGGVCFLVTF